MLHLSCCSNRYLTMDDRDHLTGALVLFYILIVSFFLMVPLVAKSTGVRGYEH